jgi:hypothetical protein
VQCGSAHTLEVLPYPLQNCCSGIKLGELLLDGGGNSFLLMQRSNGHGKGLELILVYLGENRPALDL